MVIGLLTVHLVIDGCDSLKDKRQILKSLMAHLKRKFNISVAEVGDHELWRRSEVAVAIVSTESKYADQVMAQVINHIESDPRVSLQGVHTEIL